MFGLVFSLAFFSSSHCHNNISNGKRGMAEKKRKAIFQRSFYFISLKILSSRFPHFHAAAAESESLIFLAILSVSVARRREMKGSSRCEANPTGNKQINLCVNAIKRRPDEMERAAAHNTLFLFLFFGAAGWIPATRVKDDNDRRVEMK